MKLDHKKVTDSIEAVRHFNRFYTQRIGVLHKHLLQTPFSLVEGRVLRELADTQKTTATALRSKLALDRGYLSRILRGFAARRLIQITYCKNDDRQKFLELTGKGRRAHSLLNARAQHHAASILDKLSRADQKRLVATMRTIEKLMTSKSS
ncbi:MAG TPA: MarR family winged helix-turn-helix transcriptional regulator [Candidatus Udaeobacter sp.]|jgi:DNA-binding MarR family transcriptional regulator|nr:MarR family winged helix-turn-helix transcriptional regulator [Candidatus Udaeobacter sp.]